MNIHSFLTNHAVSQHRVDVFEKKEPDTNKWIDSFQSDEVFIDVGANIGLYSIYAAQRRAKVYSFEPESQNYALLCKNIAHFGLDIKAYCCAISNKTKFDFLYVKNIVEGNSGSMFGVDSPGFKQGCISTSLDQMLNDVFPQPDYVKIDIDGLEKDVVDGGSTVLRNSKSFLIEIDDGSESHQEIVKQAVEWGFTPSVYRRKDNPVNNWIFSRSG